MKIIAVLLTISSFFSCTGILYTIESKIKTNQKKKQSSFLKIAETTSIKNGLYESKFVSKGKIIYILHSYDANGAILNYSLFEFDIKSGKRKLVYQPQKRTKNVVGEKYDCKNIIVLKNRVVVFDYVRHNNTVNYRAIELLYKKRYKIHRIIEQKFNDFTLNTDDIKQFHYKLNLFGYFFDGEFNTYLYPFMIKKVYKSEDILKNTKLQYERVYDMSFGSSKSEIYLTYQTENKSYQFIAFNIKTKKYHNMFSLKWPVYETGLYTSFSSSSDIVVINSDDSLFWLLNLGNKHLFQIDLRKVVGIKSHELAIKICDRSQSGDTAIVLINRSLYLMSLKEVLRKYGEKK